MFVVLSRYICGDLSHGNRELISYTIDIYYKTATNIESQEVQVSEVWERL